VYEETLTGWPHDTSVQKGQGNLVYCSENSSMDGMTSSLVLLKPQTDGDSI